MKLSAVPRADEDASGEPSSAGALVYASAGSLCATAGETAPMVPMKNVHVIVVLRKLSSVALRVIAYQELAAATASEIVRPETTR